MWRHGDVFIERVETIPVGRKKLRLPVLAEGELTGHAHRILEPQAAVFFEGTSEGERFFEITTPTATVTHEEHGPITLERGKYRSWIQREYHPEEIRRVLD